MLIQETIRNQDVGLPEVDPFVVTKHRYAARGVILMGQKVALMYSSVYNYYKLPGGGVEDGEDAQEAFAREIREETGCTAKIIRSLGTIIEERGEEGFRQVSDAYLATQYGTIAAPQLTEREQQSGFEVRWANDIDHAIALVDDGRPENGGGKFMKRRDGMILRTAKLLQQDS